MIIVHMYSTCQFCSPIFCHVYSLSLQCQERAKVAKEKRRAKKKIVPAPTEAEAEMERKKPKFGEVVQRPPSFTKEIFWVAGVVLEKTEMWRDGERFFVKEIFMFCIHPY